MALFPQDAHAFTLLLQGADADMAGGPVDAASGRPIARYSPSCVLVDVFPHRIIPQDGYSLDDAILTLLMAGHTPRHSNWNAHAMEHWAQPYGSRAFFHPIATVHPGAVLFSQPLASTPISPQAILVHMTDTAITIGDTRFDRDAFSAITYQTEMASRYRETLHRARDTHPLQHALALGVVSAFAHSAQALPLELMVPTILARFARIAKECPASGQAALETGVDKGLETVRALRALWDIRPDRLGATTRLVAHPDFDELRTHAERHTHAPQAFAAGQAAYAALEQALQGHTALGASELSGARKAKPQSAHTRLALKVLHTAIDTALLRGMPAATLTPMAAKQRGALLADMATA